MMQAFGVPVAVVEMMPHLLPGMDKDLGDHLSRILSERGIDIYTDTKVNEVQLRNGLCEVKLSNGKKVKADRILIAVGREPNTDGIGLNTIGLTSERGFVRVNDRMETAVRGVYCVGDANGRCMLAHAASAQGMAAAENAVGSGEPLIAPVPLVAYTFPEIAAVGMTEQKANEQGVPIYVGRFPLSYLGKTLAVGEPNGFAKVICHHETDELLGVHILGHNASECIATAGVLLGQEMNAKEMASIIVPHPSVSESMKEAAQDAFGATLNQPLRDVGVKA
jgi:dihydrolipoamide dehydrogenase